MHSTSVLVRDVNRSSNATNDDSTDIASCHSPNFICARLNALGASITNTKETTSILQHILAPAIRDSKRRTRLAKLSPH